MDVSIIIVNYNNGKLISDCLRSIYQQTRGIHFEIIVVDNDSKENIAAFLYPEFADIQLVRIEENVGFGKANNEGFKVAQGRNVLCLNPDTILINNAIKILSDYLDEHQEVGACGGNLFDESMQPTLSFRRIYPGIRWELCEMTAHKLESIFFGGNWSFNHTSTALSVAYISGADLMIKRHIIKETGGFSPLFFMYSEETDLCHRITSSGYKIMSVPSAQIQHLEGKSFKQDGQVNEKRLWLSEQGRLTYYKKNVHGVKYYLANGIYWLSLHLLYLVSCLTKRPSRKAFRCRIRFFKQLM